MKEQENTVEEQLLEARQEIAELRKTIRSYDLVANNLPAWIKVIVIMAGPDAYNGVSAGIIREKLKQKIDTKLREMGIPDEKTV